MDFIALNPSSYEMDVLLWGASSVKINRDSMTWDANDETDLENVLWTRDCRGGGQFWLADEEAVCPYIAIRVTGNLSEIYYLPHDGHPGFRCVGGHGLPRDGSTLFVFDGCDPYDGEESPNEFVVPFATALMVAKAFLRDKKMPSCVEWFEL